MRIDVNAETARIKGEFLESVDLTVRGLNIAGTPAMALFLDGLNDKREIDVDIFAPLLKLTEPFAFNAYEIEKRVYSSSAVKQLDEYSKAINMLACGDMLLLIDGAEFYFIFEVKKYDSREVSEPPTSSVLKGPREGFVENIKTNMGLLRRRLKTKSLVYESATVGRYSSTKIVIAYISGIAKPELVEIVRKKIAAIDIDGVLDSAYISTFLEKPNKSLFRQVGTSEKPDIVAAKILEGRVAVIVEGSPIVLTLPFMMIEDFQDSQDYYKKNLRSTFVRLIRLIGAFMALILPAFFVSVQEYDFPVLPLEFSITIINSVSGIPFTPTLEMLLALFIFEVLNEASVRMPRYVGMALSIVGAIVLGQTAVEAGFLSSMTVLISSLSAIGLYAVPEQVGALSVLRILLVCSAGLIGMLGLIISLLFIIAYLTALENFGVPYLAPYAPLTVADIKDTFFEAPIREMKTRPKSIPNVNSTRKSDAEIND